MWSVKTAGRRTGIIETVSHQYIFAVVFALGIIGMLVITWLSEDNVTILNYENKVIDKYEIWEKQLDERESQLEERELRLTEQEAE